MHDVRGGHKAQRHLFMLIPFDDIFFIFDNIPWTWNPFLHHKQKLPKQPETFQIGSSLLTIWQYFE